MENFEIRMPEGIETILNTLHQAGFEASLAGGCVRDALRGEIPHDYDITTNALPQQVQALFDHTIPTGAKHGTITVLCQDAKAEVTTYRKEGDYQDHRHPDSVEFVSSLAEDLSRRDFTINAMAWSKESGLIDLFGGVDDLKKGIIRTVGDPEKRFEEDALRMFRAFRFAARFGFDIDEKTLQAIHDREALASCLAVERIVPEIEAVLRTDPARIEQMTGLLRPWIPELEVLAATEQNSPYHYTDVLHHTLDALKAVKTDDPSVLWALLLHDAGKPQVKDHWDGKDHFKGHEKVSAQIAARVMKALKLPSKVAREVPVLVRDHDTFYAPKPVSLYKLRVRKGYSKELAEKLFQVQYGDIMAHKIHDRLAQLEAFRSFYEQAQGVIPLSIAELQINGKDVIENTDLQKEKRGEALRYVLEQAILEPNCRNREKQIEVLRRFEKMENAKERKEIKS